MKTTKLTIHFTLFAVITVFGLMLAACDQNSSITNTLNDKSNSENGDYNGGVIVEAQYTPGNPGYYSFWLRNNMTDTIVNDFHVQFDTSLIITSHTPRSGWITDNSTTDTAKGKVGVKCNQSGCEFRPGEHGYPLSNVRLASTKLSVPMTFRWQATRNGTVVAQGMGNLP